MLKSNKNTNILEKGVDFVGEVYYSSNMSILVTLPSLTANKPRIPYFREIPACFMFKNVVYG